MPNHRHALIFPRNWKPCPGAGRAARAGRVCEPRSTAGVATALLAAALLVACGGSSRTETYQKAVSKQEACCNELSDTAARDQCLNQIVRVEDPEVQKSDYNLATHACIERHFVCDATTGGPTQESSQKQLDCINDLDR